MDLSSVVPSTESKEKGEHLRIVFSRNKSDVKARPRKVKSSIGLVHWESSWYYVLRTYVENLL